jgi:hypothetical protein
MTIVHPALQLYAGLPERTEDFCYSDHAPRNQDSGITAGTGV